MRAADRKTLVIDGGSDEGSIAASVLGAIDVDEWNAFRDRCYDSPLADALNSVLARFGEPWRVRLASGLPRSVVEIDPVDLGKTDRLDIGAPHPHGGIA